MPQLLLGFSVDGIPMSIHPMSPGDPTSATYDRKAGKPPLYSTNPAVLPGTTYIDRLPTELLRECFELAVNREAPLTPRHRTFSSVEDAQFASQQQAYTSAQAICLTCKKFWAIMTPTLYSRIQLLLPPVSPYEQEKPDDRVSMRFIRTMNTALATREHLKGLSISMQHFSRIKPIPGLEGSGFTRLRKISLAVTDAWSTREWDACCANLRNLPVLSELLVDLRYRCKNDFRPFHRMLGQLRHLSVLTLDGVSSDRSSHNAFDWGSDRADFGIDQVALPSQDTNGSASFTQLHLLSFGHSSPAGLGKLLSSSPSLETLTLDTLGFCGYSLDDLVEMGCLFFRWTFDQLKELLLPHRSTLQELRIRQHGPGQEGLDRFDLQEFEDLHTLQLCTLCLPTPELACDLWLTPSLQRLAFESSWVDSQCGMQWYFGESDVAWLAAFVEMAKDRRKSGLSGLSIIEVICGTSQRYPLTDSERSDVEASCSKAKEIVKSHGFEFIWREET